MTPFTKRIQTALPWLLVLILLIALYSVQIRLKRLQRELESVRRTLHEANNILEVVAPEKE